MANGYHSGQKFLEGRRVGWKENMFSPCDPESFPAGPVSATEGHLEWCSCISHHGKHSVSSCSVQVGTGAQVGTVTCAGVCPAANRVGQKGDNELR